MAHTTYRTTGTLTGLVEEWTHAYVGRVHTFGDLGVMTCGELEERLHSLPQDLANAQLHTVLSLVQEGDVVSERLVLQLMLPKAVQLARTCAGLRSLGAADAQWTAIGAMWEAIRTYPLHRTSSVTGNLGLNALAIITLTLSGSTKGVDEFSVLDEELEDAANRNSGGESVEPARGDSSLHDLVKVLTWAVDTETLTREEVAMLARADLGDQDDRDELADELGISRTTLSKRVWRTRTKLMEAVQEYIRTNGRW